MPYHKTLISFHAAYTMSCFSPVHRCTLIGCCITIHGRNVTDSIYLNNRKLSNISRTKSPNLNVSRFVESLPNPMKPGVTSRMKMLLEQRRQAVLQLVVVVVVVVFYWPLGSKQISKPIYVHITHTKHGMKVTSAHQSNKEINVASVSVDFVWYNRDFFYISITQDFMKRASPYSPSAQEISWNRGKFWAGPA